MIQGHSSSGEQRAITPASAPPPRLPRRPDESMTLLTELMDRPLDPAYAAAAAARGATPRHPRPWNSALVGVTALAAGLLFATSAIAFAQPDVDRNGRSELVTRIEDGRREVDERSDQVARLRADVGARQAGALQESGVDPSALAVLGAAAGDTPVTGPGLRVTLDDAQGLAPAGQGEARAGAHDDTGRIVYRDLQQVTNELWAAGAEAVAINGHRLTSTSAIRFAGPAILVNFRPLARPYVVDAVMGEGQAQRFVTGPGGDYLSELRSAYSVRADVRPQSDLALPAADSTSLRYARPIAPDQPPTGDTSSASTTSPAPGDRKDDE